MTYRKYWLFGVLLFLPASGWTAEGDVGVQIEVKDDHIDFLAGKELVGRYQIGKDRPKPIFWPLLAPGGIRVTRSWPMEEAKPGVSTDHPHQQSAWFCHGDIIPEGIDIKDKIRGIEGVDFWSIAKGHGWIVCTKVGKPHMNGAKGGLTTRNEWRTSDGVKILDETRRIFFYDLVPSPPSVARSPAADHGQPITDHRTHRGFRFIARLRQRGRYQPLVASPTTDDGPQTPTYAKARLLVFDIDLTASVCPITFGDTKEGAMGIRINDAIVEEARIGGKTVRGPGTMQNAEGKLMEKGCWGQISAWCDYSGPVEGKTVGLTLLADPKNRYPSCWHSRGYGLMAANPFGRNKAAFPAVKGRTDLVRLDKGEHLHLRYGILVHEGNADTGQVANHYQQFVNFRAQEEAQAGVHGRTPGGSP